MQGRRLRFSAVYTGVCDDKVSKVSELGATEKMKEGKAINCIQLFAVFEIKASVKVV